MVDANGKVDMYVTQVAQSNPPPLASPLTLPDALGEAMWPSFNNLVIGNIKMEEIKDQYNRGDTRFNKRFLQHSVLCDSQIHSKVAQHNHS